MMNRLMIRMEQSGRHFSKGQRKIAAFLKEHYDKAAFMTASKLGETVGVSESTVVRFATEIGYEGYPQLQKALQEMIRNRLTAVQRMEVTRHRLGEEEDLLSKVIQVDMEYLRRTVEEVDRDAFDRAVELILGANRIFIMGVRSSASLSTFISFYFNQIFDRVYHINPSATSAVFEQMVRISPGDVLMVVTFSRYSTRTREAAAFAKARGASIVAITDSALAPVVEYADAVLTARSGMASFADSLVAPLSLVNALFVAIGMRKEEEIVGNYRQLETIWEEYNVYEKDIDVR